MPESPSRTHRRGGRELEREQARRRRRRQAAAATTPSKTRFARLRPLALQLMLDEILLSGGEWPGGTVCLEGIPARVHLRRLGGT